VAALLALELARDEAIRQAREETRRGDPLPADGPPWVVMLATQRSAEGPDDIAAREETRAELRLLMSSRPSAPARAARKASSCAWWRQPPRTTPIGLGTADRLATFLDRTVAVSRRSMSRAPRPAAEGRGQSHARSRGNSSQLRLASCGRRGSRHTCCSATSENLPDGVRQARELLAPILVGREDAQRERIDTLAAVLSSPSLAEAALGSACTATRSRTASSGSRHAAIGTCRTRTSASP
jgi:hypothetical protein